MTIRVELTTDLSVMSHTMTVTALMPSQLLDALFDTYTEPIMMSVVLSFCRKCR